MPSPAKTENYHQHLNVVVVGHVDHGKSTLVGRLLHDTDSLPEGKLAQVHAMCEKRGMPFEWAFLLDALQAERDQAITIDTTQIPLRTKKRDYTLIDAPGHKEFLQNMITGATQADAALVIIDATQGVREQSHRHGYLLHLLGIKTVAIVINKVDLIDYEEEQCRLVEEEYSSYLASLDIIATGFIPVSARHGDNITSKSPTTPWYKGPCLTQVLDSFPQPAPQENLPLRMITQDVYKFDQRRIIVGRVASGKVSLKDTLVFSPSNKTARLKSIETWPNTQKAGQHLTAGQSFGITLDDEIFVERGEIISHTLDAPLESDVINARVFWLGAKPLVENETLTMKLGAMECPVNVQKIDRVINTDTLSEHAAKQVAANQVAKIILRAKKLLAFDAYTNNKNTSRFVLLRGFDTVGGGVLSLEDYANQRVLNTPRSSNITRVSHQVTRKEREKRHGHTGGILWFTGLSGTGKSTLAVAFEKILFNKGYSVAVMDGDNVRHGLNADLGFTPEDRAENIRRISEVASLFAENGILVITAFISPYRSDRDKARRKFENFHEVHIDASIETCKKRDPKKLYQKAAQNKIPQFTGINAPYEPPENPELVVNTEKLNLEDSLTRLSEYVEKHFTLKG